MTVETVARTIQYILAPVVMVSACAVLLTGLLGRYADISARLRALSRERLDLVMGSQTGEANPEDSDVYKTERLQEIDHQAPELLRRHRLVRDSALSLYTAVFFFVVDMGLIGEAVLMNSDDLAEFALAAFMIGLAALLAGILFVVIEMSNSHTAVRYEMERVLKLTRSQDDPARSPHRNGEAMQTDKRIDQKSGSKTED